MNKSNASKNEEAVRDLLHELDMCDPFALDDRIFINLFWVLIKEVPHEEFVNLLSKIKPTFEGAI